MLGFPVVINFFHTSRLSAASAMTCKRGTSATEFALILPLLTLLTMGTLQIGLLMYSYNTMVSSARDSARAMAVCTVTDLPTAKAQALANLPAWVAASDWTITPVISTDVSMTISVDPAKAAIISYVPFDLGTLTTKVTMRKEPLAFGGGAC